MSSSTFQLNSAWSKIASAGQSVVVQNLGGMPLLIATATGAPVTTTGIVLEPSVLESGVLVTDLWARSDDGSVVLVADAPFTTGATPAGTVTGQVRIATTGTPVQLPSNALVNGLAVKAKATNSQAILVGGSGVTTTFDGTGNGYPLEPGAAASFAVANSSALYVNGTAGDVVSFGGN